MLLCLVRSPARDPIGDEATNNDWDKVVQNEHAQARTDEDAAPNGDFAAHGGPNQLLVHLEGVQGEVDTAHWGRQVGLSVRVVTSRANFVLVSEFHRRDVDAHADMTIVNCFLGALLLVDFDLLHWHPEALSILFELESWGLRLLQRSHVLGVVLLVNAERSLSKLCIVKWLFEFNLRSSNNVVALEEVSIVSLNSEGPVLRWVLNLEVKTVVEASLSSLASVVGVSLKRFLAVKEGTNVDVRSAFCITHLNVFCIEDTNTHLELLWWLGLNVPHLGHLLWRHICLIDFNPHFEGTLWGC